MLSFMMPEIYRSGGGIATGNWPSGGGLPQPPLRDGGRLDDPCENDPGCFLSDLTG